MLLFLTRLYSASVDLSEFIFRKENCMFKSKIDEKGKQKFSVIYETADDVERITILYIILLLKNDELCGNLPLLEYRKRSCNDKNIIFFDHQHPFKLYLTLNEWIYEYIRLTILILLKHKCLVKFLIPNLELISNQNIFVPISIYFNIRIKNLNSVLLTYFQIIAPELLKMADKYYIEKVINNFLSTLNIEKAYKCLPYLLINRIKIFSIYELTHKSLEINYYPIEYFNFNNQLIFKKISYKDNILIYSIEPTLETIPIINNDINLVIKIKNRYPKHIYLSYNGTNINFLHSSTYLYAYIKYFIIFILNIHSKLENDQYVVSEYGVLKRVKDDFYLEFY